MQKRLSYDRKDGIEMMNKKQAIAYGKKIGCKFYVKNGNGGLLGGFTTLEAAKRCKGPLVSDWAIEEAI